MNAHAGDSRAVLCRGSKAIQLTDDHKPEREDEAVSGVHLCVRVCVHCVWVCACVL